MYSKIHIYNIYSYYNQEEKCSYLSANFIQFHELRKSGQINKKCLAIFAGWKFCPDSVQTSAQTVLSRRIQLQWHDLAADTCSFQLLWIIVTRTSGFALFLPFRFDRLQDFDRGRVACWVQQTRENLSQRRNMASRYVLKAHRHRNFACYSVTQATISTSLDNVML